MEFFIINYVSSQPYFSLKNYNYIEGYLVEDSKNISASSTIFKVKVCKIKNNFTECSSNSIITIFTKSTDKRFKGELFYANLEKKSEEFFYSKNIICDGVFKNKFYKWRKFVLNKITANLFFNVTESAALFDALFMGNRDDLSSSLMMVFKDSGCQHLIALSGMHLAIIVGILNLGLSKILRKRDLLLVTSILLTLYLVLTGAGASLKRAWLMFIIQALFNFFHLKFRMLDLLSFTFIILATLFPLDIYNYGFILSFSAVLGILMFSKKIEYILSLFLPKVLSSSFSVSYSAQIFVVPVLFIISGKIAILGIFASILAAPLMTLFMYARLIALFLSLINFKSIAYGFALVSELFYKLLKIILILFSKVPQTELFPFGFIFFIPLFLIFSYFMYKIFLKRIS